MGRILFFILIAFLIYLLFRGFMRAQAKKDLDAAPPKSPLEPEDMVACARCGVNVPRSSAREEAGRWVCLGNPNCK